MRQLLLSLAVLVGLLGCSPAPGDGFAAFVVNQDAHSQAKPGKSYSVEPCSMPKDTAALVLQCGASGAPNSLTLRSVPGGRIQSLLGKTLPVSSGTVQLDKQLSLESGSITVQTLDGDVARGNFNARVAGQNPPWEVVGSFVARVK